MSRCALSKVRIRLGCTIMAASAFALLGRPVWAQQAPDCKNVEGHLTEHVTNPGPPLQTSGPVTGVLAGTYDFTLGSVTPAAAGVDLFTATSTIHTRNGDLNLAEAGSIDFGSGNIADLWTVVSGTGKLKGATGQMFAFGNFNGNTGTGAVRYRGEVCVP